MGGVILAFVLLLIAGPVMAQEASSINDIWPELREVDF